MHSPLVPDILASQKPEWIKMERIFGVPYLNAPDGFDAECLGLSLAGFHNASMKGDKCLCHIDNQPANILLAGASFFFIDFSDSRMDYPERDVTHLLLFWAAEMEHERFCADVSAFLAIYAFFGTISSQRWQSCLQESIEAFDARRALFNKPGAKVSPGELGKNRKFLADYHKF